MIRIKIKGVAMKIFPVTLIFLFVFNHQTALSYSEDPFAELEQATESLAKEGGEEEMLEFQKWKAQYLAEYQDFRQQHFNRLDDIRDKLISTWGQSEVSSQSQYVEYDEASNTKTVLDFEKNEIRVSVLHNRDEKVSHTIILNALKKVSVNGDTKNEDNVLKQLMGGSVNDLVIKKLINDSTQIESSIAITQNEQAVLKKEIRLIEEQSNAQKSQVEKIYDLLNSKIEQQTLEQDKATEKQIIQQKKQIEREGMQRIAALKAQTKKLVKNIQLRDALKNKKITTFTMPLSHRKDLTKARPFINDVKNQSKRWALSPSLILAIMHTESYFNPKAESHVPAFGLMQIVPRTAGIDVNRFLFKKDKPMAESYLFKPEKNIETGVAYMHILNSRYLRKITNAESRMYCMIAAYNTGSGNVAKTFNKDGSRNISKAAKIINRLSPQQVYQYLLNNLPYAETRHYVKRVVNRKKIYAPVELL